MHARSKETRFCDMTGSWLKFVFVFAAAMASFLMLAAVYAHAAPSDWQISVQAQNGQVIDRICAKDRTTCEMAVIAVQRGWLFPELHGLFMRCEPRPGCFTAESEVIWGYNN